MEDVNMQNGYQAQKANAIFQTASTRRLGIAFLKYFLYIEKIDFEYGTRKSEKVIIGTFAINWKNILRPGRELIFR